MRTLSVSERSLCFKLRLHFTFYYVVLGVHCLSRGQCCCRRHDHDVKYELWTINCKRWSLIGRRSMHDSVWRAEVDTKKETLNTYRIRGCVSSDMSVYVQTQRTAKLTGNCWKLQNILEIFRLMIFRLSHKQPTAGNESYATHHTHARWLAIRVVLIRSITQKTANEYDARIQRKTSKDAKGTS